MFVDSHCHLNYLENPREKEGRALAAGVDKILCIGIEESRINEVLSIAKENPEVWCTVGEHPDATLGEPSWVESFLSADKVVAVGETGLDFFRDDSKETKSLQSASFDRQLQMGTKYSLPVVVHTRGAQKETIELIKSHPGVIGVLHCFTESWEMAKQALDLGFYISISGIVTFKNAGVVKEVAALVPADRLLIETDAPWLAPVPKRGKSNEPAFLAHTAACVADLRGETVRSIAQTTSQNFHDLFSRVS